MQIIQFSWYSFHRWKESSSVSIPALGQVHTLRWKTKQCLPRRVSRLGKIWLVIWVLSSKMHSFNVISYNLFRCQLFLFAFWLFFHQTAPSEIRSMKWETSSVDKLLAICCLSTCSTVAVLINLSGRRMFELKSFTLVPQIFTWLLNNNSCRRYVWYLKRFSW